MLKYADNKYVVEELKSYKVFKDTNTSTIMEVVTTKNKYYPEFPYTKQILRGEEVRDYGSNNLIQFCKDNNINTRIYMSDYIYDRSYDKVKE